MALGFYQTSVSGMNSQTQALSVIADNITNATTNGYKRSDVNFSTLVSRTYNGGTAGPDAPLSCQSDIGGVAASTIVNVSEAGQISQTGEALDAAILGRGFFMLQKDTSAEGIVYGRDGSCSIDLGGTTTVTNADGSTKDINEGYLVDKNGYYLLGWAANTDGTFPASGDGYAPMRVDPDAFTDVGSGTTQMSVSLNLPASDSAGDVHTSESSYIDDLGVEHACDLSFTKDSTNNSWSFNVVGETGDSVVVTPSADSLNPSSQGQSMTFGSNGEVEGPVSYTVSITRPDGTTSQFSLDTSGFTQYAGDYVAYGSSQDGRLAGDLNSVEFDSNGYVIGRFDNGRTKPLYRIAMADFTNPDGLQPLSGNVFALTDKSGDPEIAAAGVNGMGTIAAGSREGSNVDLADEFSRMILTQNAYNTAATAFRTADEMTTVARDLKR